MRSILLLLALAATSFAQLPKPPVGVPADARFHNGRWYKVILEKTQWNRAKEKCHSLGGQLACVPDEETWAFMRPIIGDLSLWLGGTDEAANGAWKWVDGTTMTFTAWYKDQPDNSRGVENYLATYKGQWNDAPRDGQFMQGQFVVGYVCEWKAR